MTVSLVVGGVADGLGDRISQIAASWGIAPSIAAGFGALIFLSIKLLVLKRADPLKWGLRLIPFYFGITGGIFALFISKLRVEGLLIWHACMLTIPSSSSDIGRPRHTAS